MSGCATEADPRRRGRPAGKGGRARGGERAVSADASARAQASQAVSPLAEALSAANLALVDLDQWGHAEQQAEARRAGWTPAAPSPASSTGLPGSRTSVGGAPGASPSVEKKTDPGRFVSSAPNRPPDSAGDLGVTSVMRVFADVTVAGETGLLRFERQGEVKEVFLTMGSLESFNSSVPLERFGAYLVSRGVLPVADVERALGMLPHFSGKLGDTLVGLGLMRPLDVFRQLSQQLRDRVIDLFSWSRGTFAFFRGVKNEQGSFPLGLDGFEIWGPASWPFRRQIWSSGFRLSWTAGPSARSADKSIPMPSASGPRHAKFWRCSTESERCARGGPNSRRPTI